jgi:hypothetical protein
MMQIAPAGMFALIAALTALGGLVLWALAEGAATRRRLPAPGRARVDRTRLRATAPPGATGRLVQVHEVVSRSSTTASDIEALVRTWGDADLALISVAPGGTRLAPHELVRLRVLRQAVAREALRRRSSDTGRSVRSGARS